MTTVSFTPQGSGEQAASTIAGNVRAARAAIDSGDWLDAGMAITNVAMDVINIAGDPLGAAASAGFGWIIQHISFLREPFDALLGDANSIMGSAQGWNRTGDQLAATAQRYRQAAREETCNWHGSAGDAYRNASSTQAEGLEALAQVSRAIGQAVTQAGQLLAEVRNTVLQMINQCVQRVIMIIIEALSMSWLSFGASIARGIAQSVQTAVQTAQKIISKVQKFVSSLQKILQTIQKIVNLAKSVKQLLETIGGRANTSRRSPAHQATPVDTSGIDAAANRRYTNPSAVSGPTYAQGAVPGYSYDQYRPGTPAGQPSYGSPAPVPGYGGFQPVPGGGQRPGGSMPPPPGRPSPYGPSGPPPTPGAPASRVDRARWIGSAVEILINHGVPPERIDAGQIAQIVDRLSGGNPHAMDMGHPAAGEGTPPKGLMQLTDPQFQQHQVPGYPNIWEPVDNLLAGVMHVLAQWGSLMAALEAPVR
ncbi:WXG100-like domain-containing protein [Actinokineospora sp. NPDC004072]